MYFVIHFEIINFFNFLLSRFGAPQSVLTDQGREFCNCINDNLCSQFQIKHRVATAYHPQCNGRTERFNQTLERALSKYVNNKQNDWESFLQRILFAYRTAPQKSTKMSPFELLYGFKARIPIEIDTAPAENIEWNEDSREKLILSRAEELSNLTKKRELAKSKMDVAQSKQEIAYNAKHQAPNFKIGDKGFVINRKRDSRMGGKLEARSSNPSL